MVISVKLAIVLFAVAITAVTAVAEIVLSEQTSSSKLIINLDGSDAEWVDLVGWVCPANYPQGGGCPTPSTDYTAWLCCNTTTAPKECQLIWRDKVRDAESAADIRWIRLYVNTTGVYVYVNALYEENRYIWLTLQLANTTSFKLNIVTYLFITRILNIPLVYITAWYSLYNPAGLPIRWGMIGSIDYILDVASKVVALEIAMPSIGVPGFFSPTGPLRVAATLSRDLLTVDTSSGSTGEIVLEVMNWYIVGARALNDPIPVPEPSISITLTIMATVIGLTAFTLNRQKIYEYSHRAIKYRRTASS